MLFGAAALSRASHDRADRVDAPVAGGKSGVCVDAAFVVTHLRGGKTEALDGRRTAGGDQNVRTRDRFFMPGGGDENTNAVAARLDPRNPHVLMNDNAVARERGAHRRSKFFVFRNEYFPHRKHDRLASEPAHRLREREPIRIGADDDKTPGRIFQPAERGAVERPHEVEPRNGQDSLDGSGRDNEVSRLDFLAGRLAGVGTSEASRRTNDPHIHGFETRLRIIRRDRRMHRGGTLTHAREIDLRLFCNLRHLGGDAESGGATRRSGGPARRQQDVARNGIGKSPATKRAFFDEHDGPAASRRPKRQRETTGAPADDT